MGRRGVGSTAPRPFPMVCAAQNLAPGVAGCPNIPSRKTRSRFSCSKACVDGTPSRSSPSTATPRSNACRGLTEAERRSSGSRASICSASAPPPRSPTRCWPPPTGWWRSAASASAPIRSRSTTRATPASRIQCTYSNTRSVAELVIAKAVMLMRRIPEKSEAAHHGLWQKSAAHSYRAARQDAGYRRLWRYLAHELSVIDRGGPWQ